MSKKIQEHTYYVKGTDCASCEVLIEKKLLESGNIKSVEASTAKGEMLIEYQGERPTLERLNEGTGGCTNAIISKSLFNGQIPLTPDKLSIKEFTPEKPGKYKLSCWMGMISGIIEVI